MALITAAVLGLFHVSLPAEWHAFGMAGFFWLGFIMPAQVSAVIFGGTAPQWVMAKILISTGGVRGCVAGAGQGCPILSVVCTPSPRACRGRANTLAARP